MTLFAFCGGELCLPPTKRRGTLSRQDPWAYAFLYIFLETTDRGELNEILKRAFLKKQVKHLLPESLFEERRYEGDLYVFEE